MGGRRAGARRFGLALAITAMATAGAAASEGEWIQVEPGPRHLWSGESVSLAVRVVNHDAASVSGSLQWRFALSGAILARGDKSLTLAAGASERIRIDFQAPRVRHACSVAWHLILLRGAEARAASQIPLAVYPSWDPQPLQRLFGDRRVAIADPSGRLRTVLLHHGLTSRLLATPQAVSSFRGQVIVLGPDASLARNLTQAALEAARAGLNVLWLEPGDTSRWQGRFGVPGVSRAQPGALAIRAPGHPALGEMRSRDLESWRGPVGSGFLMKPPEGGNFRALVSARDNPEGLALLEVFPGKGRIVLCQQPVVSRFAAEPAARLLFESLLRYALERPPVFRPVAIWAPPDSGLRSLAERAGAKLSSDGMPALSLLIVAADAEAARYARTQAPAVADKIHAHLAAGGRCLFLGAEPASLAWLEEAGVRGVALEPAPTGAVLLPAAVPLAWGLAHDDLAAAARAGDGEPAFRYAATARGDARVGVSPGAVVKVAAGAGEAVLCQLALQRAPESAAAVAILQQLLTNLGARLKQEDR